MARTTNIIPLPSDIPTLCPQCDTQFRNIHLSYRRSEVAYKFKTAAFYSPLVTVPLGLYLMQYARGKEIIALLLAPVLGTIILLNCIYYIFPKKRHLECSHCDFISIDNTKQYKS